MSSRTGFTQRTKVTDPVRLEQLPHQSDQRPAVTVIAMDALTAVLLCRQSMQRAIALLPNLISTTALPPRSTNDTEAAVLAALSRYREPFPRSPILAIERLAESDAFNRFRFTVDEMKEFVVALELPPYLVVNRVSVSSLFSLALLLRRLAWSSRHSDLSIEFGYDDTTISQHFNHLLLLLATKYSALLRLWPGVTRNRIVTYERAINDHSPAIHSIWCFLDGTLRKIAKPVRHQRIAYSGHKRTHGYTHQALVAPDGLVVSIVGPYAGSMHDVTVWQESGMHDTLTPLATQGNTIYHIFGDKAYGGQPLIMTPFKPAVTAAQRMYNKAMSQLRVAVENGFGRVIQLWLCCQYNLMVVHSS